MPTIVKRLMPLMAALLPLSTFAQQQAPSWMVDTMYGSGKIITVVLVVSVVLIGIATWMTLLDRRLRRLEKRK